MQSHMTCYQETIFYNDIEYFLIFYILHFMDYYQIFLDVITFLDWSMRVSE